MAINFFNSLAVGTDVLYVDTLNDRVGIGTASPSFKTTIYSDSTTDSFPLVVGQPNAGNEFVGIGLSGFVASNGAVKAGFVLDRKNTYGVGDIHILNNTTTDNSNATLADSKFTILQNSNVGIGTTSPSTKLEVAGTVGNFQTTGHQIFLTRNGNNEIYAVGASSVLALGTNSAEKMRIDSSGNIGIGTTSPSGKIHLLGSYNSQFFTQSTGGTTNKFGITSGTAYAAFTVGSSLTQAARFYHDNSYITFAENGANVGIGTTSPAEKLDVSGTIQSSANEGKIVINSTATNGKEYQLISIDTGNLGLFDGTAYRLWVAGSGNIGIGTTSPSTKLHLSDTSDSIIRIQRVGVQELQLNSDGTVTAASTDLKLVSTGNISFTANSSERMRIDSSGNVSIGDSSARNARLLLNNAGSQGAPQLMLIDSGDSGKQSEIRFDSGNLIFDYWSGSSRSERMRIGSAGQIGIGGANYGTSGQVLTSNGSGSAPSWQNAGAGSSNWTLSGNDIYNNNSGDVGIGTTTPGYKLDVNGTVSTNGGKVVIRDDSIENHITNGNATIAFNYYGYQTGSTQFRDVAFYNGKQGHIMTIDGSSSSVGIGTTTPSQKLHVAGNVTADRYYGNGSTVYYVDPNDSTTAAVLAGGLEIGYGSAGEYRIEVGEGRTGNGYAYIDFVGDTTYSDYGLRLIRNNSGANTSSQLVHRGTGNLEFKTWDAGAMLFSTTNSERMRITSGGNVGIGTSSPASKLHIQNSAGGSGGYLKITDVTYGGDVRFGMADGVNNDVILGSWTNNSILVYTNTAERARITNTGNVGIGTTSPGYKLEVNGTAKADEFVSLVNTSNSGITRDWTIIGTGSVGAGLQVNDISGAKYAIYAGGYDLTFGKHVSSNNTYTTAMAIYAANATDSSPYVQATHSFRAPIFYDTNNSDRYVDPSSTSRINRLEIENTSNQSTPTAYMQIGSDGFQFGGNNNGYEVNSAQISAGYHTSNSLNFVGMGTTSSNRRMDFWAEGGFYVSGNIFDKDATSYYLRPGGTSNLEKLQVDGLFGSSVRRITNPGGATYLTTTSSVTGGLLIQLPTARRGSNTMMQMTINVYQYNTGRSFQLRVGGYNYNSTNSWVNVFAYLIGDQSFPQPLNVRFGDDGTRNWIMIGETNTVWAYPQFQVTDFQAGYSGVSESWSDGWATSIVTSIPSGHDETRVASSALTSNNASNWSTALYAPIYYDSNDPNYYLDPAGTSNLNAATFAGYIKTEGPDGGLVLRTWTGNTSYGMLGTANMSGSEYSLLTNGTNTYISGGVNGNVYIRAGNNYSNNQLELNSSKARFYGDVQSDDQFINNGNGFKSLNFRGMVGDYDTNSTATKIIWTIGDSWNTTTSMYGLAYEYNATYGHHLALKENGTTYQRLSFYNGSSFSGTVTSNTDFRAPVFYDSNDTNYKVDPAGGSQLADIYYNFWLRNNRTASSSGLYWESGTPGAGWHIYPVNTTDMFIRSGGTNNGSLRLTVGNETARGYLNWDTGNNVGFLSSAAGWSFRVDNSGNTFATTSHRAPVFYDSNDTNYYVDPANVCVLNRVVAGTSSTSNSGTALHVTAASSSTSTPIAYFYPTFGNYGGIGVQFQGLAYGNATYFNSVSPYDGTLCSFRKSGTQVGSISVGTSSTSFNTTSDYRLKENITELTDGIERVKQLQPKRFNFIGDEDTVDGFIAHEAVEVVPESVTGEKDEVLPNGEPVYQGIDQAKLVPLLTAALQEAIAKIEDLETRIQILENQ